MLSNFLQTPEKPTEIKTEISEGTSNPDCEICEGALAVCNCNESFFIQTYNDETKKLEIRYRFEELDDCIKFTFEYSKRNPPLFLYVTQGSRKFRRVIQNSRDSWKKPILEGIAWE